MLIEVIFYDRIGNYFNGQVVELEDGVFLRSLIKSGKIDVLNPPDWTPEKADADKIQKSTPGTNGNKPQDIQVTINQETEFDQNDSN